MLKRRRDSGVSIIWWERGVYTDANGQEHRALVPMFTGKPLNPTWITTTNYYRFWIAPEEFATVIPVGSVGSARTHFEPFLAGVPPNGRVQLQLPMDLDGKRVTYTFTFEPRG